MRITPHKLPVKTWETGMNLDFLSKSYAVRRLDDDDIAMLFDLMKENMVFYRYHPPF